MGVTVVLVGIRGGIGVIVVVGRVVAKIVSVVNNDMTVVGIVALMVELIVVVGLVIV